MEIFVASNIPFYAILANRNKNMQYSLITADAQEQYSSRESSSSYLHVMLWSLLVLIIIIATTSVVE